MIVNGAARGCGRLRKGMAYAMGLSGPGGRLAPLTWTLGSMHLGNQRNLIYDQPPRQMGFIDPELTFGYEEVYTIEAARLAREKAGEEGMEFPWAAYKPHLNALPRLGLIDHVGAVQAQSGAEGYTPWSFAVELRERGPSRAIPKALARTIAPVLPMPIFFTMEIPLFVNEYALEEFTQEPVLGLPVWDRPEWGLKISDDNGDDHYGVSVLEWYHVLSRNPRAINEYRVEHHEAIFCASWITNVGVYLGDKSEGLQLPNDMKGLTPFYTDGEEYL